MFGWFVLMFGLFAPTSAQFAPSGWLDDPIWIPGPKLPPPKLG